MAPSVILQWILYSRIFQGRIHYGHTLIGPKVPYAHTYIRHTALYAQNRWLCGQPKWWCVLFLDGLNPPYSVSYSCFLVLFLSISASLGAARTAGLPGLLKSRWQPVCQSKSRRKQCWCGGKVIRSETKLFFFAVSLTPLLCAFLKQDWSTSELMREHTSNCYWRGDEWRVKERQTPEGGFPSC